MLGEGVQPNIHTIFMQVCLVCMHKSAFTGYLLRLLCPECTTEMGLGPELWELKWKRETGVADCQCLTFRGCILRTTLTLLGGFSPTPHHPCLHKPLLSRHKTGLEEQRMSALTCLPSRMDGEGRRGFLAPANR
jgi:hypothetical protein